MAPRQTSPALPLAQRLAERTFNSLERILQIEVVGGIVLLVAAAMAMVLANSPFAASYQALWHMPISIGVGELVFSRSLHFWINDVLMTVFFLAVGVEIRREIHDGALSTLRQAALPVAAAAGGVVVPALIYLLMNGDAVRSQGWAVPTATDIAFAVGVLALLGRSIPANLRVLLLALAVIDDVIAILIIAFFYSGGLDPTGFLIVVLGVLMVLGLHRIGVGAAYAYLLPGGVVWIGLTLTGAHPTLAGVVLGLLTPVRSMPMAGPPGELAAQAMEKLRQGDLRLCQPLRQLRLAQRELLTPVVRVHRALHLWVVYAIMPLFALANAGVSVRGVDLTAGGAQFVLIGVAVALVLGKPLGIISISWLTVRLGWCQLPAGVSWSGICLIGLLAGIGFTMSIFVSMLAFADPNLLDAAKSGILLGSLTSALVGIGWGTAYVLRLRAEQRG